MGKKLMGYKNLCKRLGCLLLTGSLLWGMTGCGDSKEPDREENKEIVFTEEMVPVANFQEVKFDLRGLEDYVWQGDRLIYLEKVWDRDRDMSHGTLYQVNIDGTGTPEALYKGISEDHAILEFDMGQDGFFYFLERKSETGGTGTLYLRKLDSDFQEVWLQEVEHEDFYTATQSFGFFSDMHVDIEGNILLTNYDGQGYFFDKEGQYTGYDDIQVFQSQIIDGGEQGVFVIQQVWNGGSHMNYQFRKVDFAKGRLGEAETRDLSVASKGSVENGSVLSGYDLGILISMENGLYSYEYDTGEYTELLNWQKLGVDGSTILEVCLLEKDCPPENISGYMAELSPFMEALSYNASRSDPPEIVRVGYMDREYIPEKKTVTLGLGRMPSIWLGRQVRSFNRSNMEYEIVTKNYEDMEAFTEDLLFHPDEVADILEMGWIDRDMLEEKGLLEDLKPYMKESDVVGEDDIMEVVRSACESDGQLTSMMAGFSILTLSTTAETIPTDGWTYDQLFGLTRDYPDTKLLNVYTSDSIWTLLTFTLNTYVDWEKGECHYDSPEFKQLLENIKGLSYPKNEERQTVFYSDEENHKFLNKEYLLQYNTYYGPYDYSQTYVQYKDKAWDVGFPTQDGERCCLLSPMMQFSIYSNSPNKDGAWAFLEFVLSEEGQSWYASDFGGFPVRKDAFEAYLTKPYSAVYNMMDDPTSEETIEMLREEVEYLRMEQSTANGAIAVIIDEEIQAFFAGDKTVEQCVDIIQNRVQLYL
ncbi:MAG: extracellular solute-binding protein, partial [Acetatifactor sp.]|nr:extracellular solute-binding protein [Acetatifactor sp.]